MPLTRRLNSHQPMDISALGARRLRRVARTIAANAAPDGTLVSLTQGGSTYFDYNNGCTMAMSQQGTWRFEDNDDTNSGNTLDPPSNLGPLHEQTVGTIRSSQGVPSLPATSPSSAPTSSADSAATDTPATSSAPPGSGTVCAPAGPQPASLATSTTKDAAAADATVSWASAHIEQRHAYSRAASDALRGQPRTAALRTFHLDNVILYHPDRKPSSLKSTRGTRTLFTLEDCRVVKESWRCMRCGIIRNLDPHVTNALTKHWRTECPNKENS
ncbi:hypothetical protein V8E36_001549 [Tilletia maclaganii]